MPNNLSSHDIQVQLSMEQLDALVFYLENPAAADPDDAQLREAADRLARAYDEAAEQA